MMFYLIEECYSLGIMGNCCPTDVGTMLECCDVVKHNDKDRGNSDGEDSQSGGLIGDEWKNLIFNILAGIS